MGRNKDRNTRNRQNFKSQNQIKESKNNLEALSNILIRNSNVDLHKDEEPNRYGVNDIYEL